MGRVREKGGTNGTDGAVSEQRTVILIIVRLPRHPSVEGFLAMGGNRITDTFPPNCFGKYTLTASSTENGSATAVYGQVGNDNSCKLDFVFIIIGLKPGNPGVFR